MSRTKIFIAAALIYLCTFSCAENNDERVNREILWSTVWIGEPFHPTSGLYDTDTGEEWLYIFGPDGVLKVYQREGRITEPPLESLRYVYTPQSKEMVIEEYGLFTVKEITVDRLLLEGSTGKLDLRFYSDTESVHPSGLSVK